MVTKSQQNRGSYMRLFPLGLALSALSFDVTLVCPHEFVSFRKETEIVNENFRVCLLPRISNKTNYLGILIRAAMIFNMLLRSGYEIYHICSPAFLDTWIAAFIGKIKRAPIVADIDDIWGLLEGGGRPLSEQLIEEIMLRSAISSASQVVTASQFLKSRYKRRCEKEIQVIGNGIDPNIFEGISRTKAREHLREILSVRDEAKIIFVQILPSDYSKVARVLMNMNEKGYKNVPVIVGGLPQYQNNTVPPRSELRNGLHMLPRLERIKFLEMIAGSDLVLFCMENIEWERARFPIRLTEFLASGTPLLSLPYGESRTVLESTVYGKSEGLILLDSDEESLARALQYCFENTDKLEHVASEGREFVKKNMDWMEIASCLAKLYKGLVSDQGMVTQQQA